MLWGFLLIEIIQNWSNESGEHKTGFGFSDLPFGLDCCCDNVRIFILMVGNGKFVSFVLMFRAGWSW